MIPASDLTTKVETIERHLDGGVIWPGDPHYDATRALAFPRVDPRPVAILRPRTPEAVRTAVERLVGEGVPFAVRGGGHSPAALAAGDGVVVIDTRELKALKLDVAGRTAAAQAGLTAGEYTDAAALHGLATGFGDTPTVGIAGLTLGGGVGFLSRLHGLTVDSLLGAEVVTADGRQLQVGPDSHPDLFWALRGGGGNFGVVTRLDYRLQEVPQVYGGTLVLPATPETVHGLVAAALEAPDALTTIIMVLKAPPVPFLPPEAHGKPIAIVKACFVGDRSAGEAALAPLLATGTPVMAAFDMMPYPRLLEEPPSEPMSARFATGFRDRWDTAAASAVLAAIDVPATGMRAVQLRPLGGAVARVPVDATAYAHRDRRLLFSIMASFADPATEDGAEAWLHDTRLAVAEGEAAFASFLDDWAPGRVPAAYPNGTWERLRQVKREYDPHNVFRSNHNVPPA